LAIAVLAFSAFAAVGCDGGKRHDIGDDIFPANDRFTLLYSTLGYQASGTKRFLLRQNDPGAEVSEGLAFTWRLVDDGERVVEEGRAQFAGRQFGIPFWAVDFSTVTKSGDYRIVVDSPEVRLASASFRIDDFVFFGQTFRGVALDNAEARAAPVELDFGFFDSNLRSGDAVPHARFVVGLSEAYTRRRSMLTEPDRRRMREAIERGVDYLILLTDPGTGEVQPRSFTRPFGLDWAFTDAETARALAHYAALLHGEQGDLAQRAARRAESIDARLRQLPDEYPPVLRAAVNYDLYRATRRDDFLAAAADAVRTQLFGYDLRTMERPSSDGMPHVETLHRMWRDLPDHPDRPLWENAAASVAGQYKQLLEGGVLQIVPWGATNTSRTAAEQWDQARAGDAASEAPAGDGTLTNISSAWPLARAIDASLLADMTADPALERVAAASIGWVTGMNVGISTPMVQGARGFTLIQPAALLAGVDAPAVREWSEWQWPRPRAITSLVNGFAAGLQYDDSFEGGNTSIANDGLWLYATAVYEDYLATGKRPDLARGGEAPDRDGAHVASVEPASTPESLQLLVRVADADDAVVDGARVVVAWEGRRPRDADPSDVLQVTECVTGADGSCRVVLAPGALPRPVRAAVTNIVHPTLPYDIGRDAEKTATFE
jgi:hypothetical protein